VVRSWEFIRKPPGPATAITPPPKNLSLSSNPGKGFGNETVYIIFSPSPPCQGENMGKNIAAAPQRITENRTAEIAENAEMREEHKTIYLGGFGKKHSVV
jgi:hypothetical protein